MAGRPGFPVNGARWPGWAAGSSRSRGIIRSALTALDHQTVATRAVTVGQWRRSAASLEGRPMAGPDSVGADPTPNAHVVAGPPPAGPSSSEPGRWSRLRAEWDKRLDPSQKSVVLVVGDPA
jgi:hypothetical protein